MKFIPHAAAISLIATQTVAGGLSDELVESPLIQEQEMAAPAGSSNWIIPLLIVGAIAAVAIANSDDDDDPAEPEPMAPEPMAPEPMAPV